MEYERILRTVSQPWAILPERLAVVQELVHRRVILGERLTNEEIADRMTAAAPGNGGGARTLGGVSVLPMFGILGYRMNMLLAISGGTSTAAFAQRLREALADPTTNTIVFDVDSPGGMVDGVPELADEIFAARGKKRIIAVANTLMASGAYWLASQADEIVASPSAQVGNIGVYMMHLDQSKALEESGVKPTLISAGKFKVEANPYTPLTPEAEAFIQSTVDTTYGQFIKAIARGRGVSEAEVRGGYGEGRKLLAVDAKRAGLVDRIATFEETIARTSGRRGVAGRAAEDDGAPLEASGDALALEQEQLATSLSLHA